MFSFAIDSNLLYSDIIVPMEILDMMVDLLEIEPGMTVYDPAFGYGRAFYTIFRREGFDYTSFAGLEIDPRKWRLTKIILCRDRRLEARKGRFPREADERDSLCGRTA